MSQVDLNQRFTFIDSDVRGEITQIHHSLEQINALHPYPLPIRQLLGQMLAAVSLLAARIKMEGSLVLQTHGNGPVRMLMAEITDKGQLRAIARHDDLPNEPVALLGQGMLSITLLPKAGQQYQGIVQLQGDNLNQALEEYFLSSEQLKTRIWLASDGQHAAGLLLQALPNSSDQASLSQDDDTFNRTSILAQTVTEAELLHLDVNELLFRLFNEEQVELYSPKPLHFQCTCSKERVASMLLQVGESECRNIIAEQQNIAVDCQFCHANYQFVLTDIERLFDHKTH